VSYFTDVKDFHESMGQPVGTTPAFLTEQRTELRWALIEEELRELLEGLDKKDMAATADGIADTVYVLLGLAVELGLPFGKIWREVHRSNLGKVWDDGFPRCRADAEVLKPDGWQPPQIQRILDEETEE
jgi:predicted HAD superfamily Cof-like phosphohydrolase